MQIGKRGFSILEILIVVGILATLVGLAMPAYQDYVESSRRAVMETNFRSLRKAVMECHADTGSYPTDANDLKTKLVPRYLMEIPVDPEPPTTADPVPPSWGYGFTPPDTITWGAKYQKLIQ